MKKEWALIVLATILLSLNTDRTYGSQQRGRSTATSRKARAPEPGNVQEFKGAFEKDAGKVRLVALISPT